MVLKVFIFYRFKYSVTFLVVEKSFSKSCLYGKKKIIHTRSTRIVVDTSRVNAICIK